MSRSLQRENQLVLGFSLMGSSMTLLFGEQPRQSGRLWAIHWDDCQMRMEEFGKGCIEFQLELISVGIEAVAQN